MQLEHSFTVPRPADEAFAILRDIERIAPCMPGATIESVEGEEFTGKVKVKVGPMQITYRGTAKFTEVDEGNRRGVIEARGKEARGSGTANATFTAELTERGDETDVKVTSDLAITGRPAQFGRGVMADVGEKLIGQFADCLASELAREEEAPTPAEAETQAAPADVGEAEQRVEQPPAAVSASEARPRPTDDVVDLFEVAGGSIARRLGPVVVVALVVAIIVWLIVRGR
jgi:uncharacterized protein